MKSLFLALPLVSFAAFAAVEQPQFIVPGREIEMKALNELHALYYDAAFSECARRDAWLPMATLWASEKKRRG